MGKHRRAAVKGQAEQAWALLNQIEARVKAGQAAEATDLAQQLDENFDSYSKRIADAALREQVEDEDMPSGVH